MEPDGRPTRVLFLTADMGGGTGAHMRSVIERLVRAGLDVHVLCQGPMDVTLPASVRLVRRPTYRLLDRFPLAQLRDLRQAAAIIRQIQPDIVHTYFFWAIMYARVLKALGLVRFLIENREDQGFSWTDLDYRMLQATAHIPDRVVCVSQAVQDVVVEREGLDARQVTVIHNGVIVPEQPETADEDTRLLRRELGLVPEDRVVGMVSNLNRAVKGVPYFIESMPLILAEEPRVRFVIFGDGPDRQDLEARASRLGVTSRLIFAGYRDDMAKCYPIMDVSVLTSLSEGLSMTILESMSHGIPVVATRVGGNPELVMEGKTGLLVAPKDPAAFAKAVLRVLKDSALARSLGLEAREVIRKKFSLDSVGRAYAALYSDAISEG